MPCVGPCQPALSFAQLQDVWKQAGGNPAYAPLMASIALAESGGVPNNTNPTDNGGRQTSWGLWQVSNGTHNPYPNWSDPVANAQVAVAKLNTQGLTAWGTYTNGSAQKILAQSGGAEAAIGLTTAPQATTAASPASGSGSSDSDCLIGAGVPGLSSLPVVGSAFKGCLLSRSQARAVLGALAIVPAGVLAVIGIAWMTGVSTPKLPGPAGLVGTAIGEVGATRRAKVRERTRQEGLTQRQEMREQRRRQRESESVSGHGEEPF